MKTLYLLVVLTGCVSQPAITTSPVTHAAAIVPLELEVPVVTTHSFGTVALAWDASPDTTVVGYYLFQGTVSRNYANSIDVGNTLGGLAPHPAGVTNYYAVAAYNAVGLVSDYSTELVLLPPPPFYGLIFLQASTNDGASFYDLSTIPYLRLTNNVPLPTLFRSRTEFTKDWK